MDAQRIMVRGRMRLAMDMPELLAEDYQPERSNLTALLRRAFEIEDDLLRRGA